MTTEDFIEFFISRVYRSGIADAESSLSDPPGRGPSTDLVRASEWYASLGDAERESANFAMVLAAHSVAFGALAMIDGVRHSGPERYELVAVDPTGKRTLVNPEGVDLHDLFQGLAMAPDGTFIR